MLQKKMSLTVSNKVKVKEQVDQLLNADYQLLNQREDIPNTILDCQIVKRNALIHQYISAVQSEYNISSPLKFKHPRSSSKTSSYKKLNVSLKSSKFLPENQMLKNKNKRKLTITSKPNIQSEKKQSQEINVSSSIKTPKFGFFEPSHDQMLSSQNASIPQEEIEQNRLNLVQRKSFRFLGYVDSKEKQVATLQPNHKIVSNSVISQYSATTKKIPQFSSQKKQDCDQFITQKQLPDRKTLKKIPKQLQSQEQQSASYSRNTVIHRNPIKEKIQSRPKVQTPKQIKSKDSYRYCVGCEQAILQANIKVHEKQCLRFIDLTSLTNQDLHRQLKSKIKRIEQSIPKTQAELHPDNLQHLRSRSMNLVKQSKNRRECDQQSKVFRENYEGVMEIGKKWSYAMEEVNKLRWFTRIVQKLEKMLQNH